MSCLRDAEVLGVSVHHRALLVLHLLDVYREHRSPKIFDVFRLLSTDSQVQDRDCLSASEEQHWLWCKSSLLNKFLGLPFHAYLMSQVILGGTPHA